jgi:hypothetical protein
MSRKSRILENETLRKAFQEAYSAREGGTVGDNWRTQVMGRIRRIGPLKPAPGFWFAFEHLVWRLAPATCLLVFALAAFFVNTDFDLAYDYLDTMRTELEKPALVELLGVEG